MKKIENKYKTKWDFTDIYTSYKDPKIEKDVVDIENKYKSFAKKYESSDYTTTPEKLQKALLDWEKLGVDTMSWRPNWYLQQMLSLDQTNTELKSLKNTIYARLVSVANNVVFFSIKISKIDKKDQKRYLTSPNLKNYTYYLENIFKNAQFNLTEAEEKILNLKHQTSYNMWVDAQKKTMASASIVWKKKNMPLSEAIAIKVTLPLKERRLMHSLTTAKLKEISFMAEAEMVAVITNKKIDDDLRGHKLPYESIVLSYQNDIKTVDTLVEAVEARYRIPHKFFDLKKKLLKLDAMTAADIGIEIESSKKKVPFEKGAQIISNSFAKAGSYYKELFERMATTGRIDMFPQKGKRTGAYCSFGTGVPTVIFMNYVDNLDSVSTLAHEMGHAIHAELSKKQPPIYEDFTISVAEVASTFFENLAFDEVQKELSGKDLVYSRLGKIQDDIFTIFRQVGFFNYEKKLHSYVAQNGYMTK